MTANDEHMPQDTAAEPDETASGRSNSWIPVVMSAAFASAAWTVNHYTRHEIGAWHYLSTAITVLLAFFATGAFTALLLTAFFVALGVPNGDKLPSRRLVLTIRILAAAAVAVLIAADVDHLVYTSSVLGIIAVLTLVAGICLTAVAFRKHRFRLWEQVCGTGIFLLILSNILSLAQSH